MLKYDDIKDAASTSLYGSKAANGVVIITTKKEHLLR
jgi:TonB-dependent SusC/RagA subfamily outer membrane receptor